MPIKSKPQVLMLDEVTANKIDIEVIKVDIRSIRTETTTHNRQTEKEFSMLHKKMDRIDMRLWSVAGLIIATTVGKMIADWMM